MNMSVHAMKKGKIVFLRWLFGVFIVAWCVLIFCMSNETAVQSSERSTGIVRQFVGVFVKLFGGDSEDVALIDKLEYYVRKAAHMFLYFVLTCLVFSFLSCYCLKKKWRSLWSFLFSLFYSSTDEIHQMFVDGRSGSLFDIGVDMAGALIGVGVMFLLFVIIEKCSKRGQLGTL